MSRILPGALLALALVAGGALDQTAAQTANESSRVAPAGGAPEVQAPVPEVGSGRGGVGGGQVPNTTEPVRPTGTPTAPQATVAPAPVNPIVAPPPFGDAGQQDAAELELRALLRGERISGRVSIPDAAAGNLIQPEGREWRAFHNRTLTWVAAIAILGMAGALGLFFLIRGRIRIGQGLAGRSLVRFHIVERVNHWMVATCFIILGLSGLNLTFGRWLLLPVIGPEAFTAVSQAGKIAHNYLAFPFTAGLVVMLLLWLRDNIPNKLDLDWIKAGGGFIGSKHPKAGRFNAGQKMVFWITVLGGGLVAASGYVLIFPFTVADITGQQWAHMVHGVLSVLMVAAMLAHIYIGSLGMEGAFDAMGTGRVDYNWAKEHHALWVEQELAKAREVADIGQPNAKAAGAD